MDRTKIYFKDEIRRSFILYALGPAVGFAFVVIITCAFLWNWRLYTQSVEENRKVSILLEEEISSYKKFCEENPFGDNIVLKDNPAYVYSHLKNFTLNQKIEADFVVLDENSSVVLQGNSQRVFYIPEWQNSSPWGALGRIKSNPEKTIVEVSADYNGLAKPEIVVGHAFFSRDKKLFCLIFFLSPEKIKDILQPSLQFAISNGFGRFLYASDSRYKNQLNEIKSEYRNEKNYFHVEESAVYHARTVDNCFEVYTFSDVSFIKTTFLLLLLSIFIFLSLVVSGLFISAGKIAEEKTVTIDKIVAACENVSKGTFKGRLSVESNIEFQTIANAFNNMLDDVHTLIEENRREVREKYTAELKQLEMQFNPHFMFNTLETIKFLIKLDPERAQKTIVCLSELLRYSIDSGISVMPISEDLHYIENYLYILQLRFGERFTYSIDVPDSVKNCQIPKLILQSLIGNSVKHGFEGIDKMHVSITARSVSGRLVISVHDNGSGMDKETLKSVRSILKSEQNESGHTGLHNAQRRIKLMYGDSFGLKIESSKESGTKIKVTLPVIR
ncbi:MAG: histidine kinase [Treponema sp.]|nr:histidine kinase [Treponema sp.]